MPLGLGIGRGRLGRRRVRQPRRPIDGRGRQYHGQIGRYPAGARLVPEIVPFLPPDVFTWDDAGNNKWLISGKGALIMNPPRAWAVAKRDAPQIAEQL
jgi:hypothetical protein